MKTLPRSTAKDVFLHLLSIGTLYVTIISFIALLFQYINVMFPDVLSFYYTGALDTIRQTMASIIVVWPVFLFVTWLIYRDLRQDPQKQEVGIRKWLLYLTLFVTSITIIVDLITLINYFLNGEITTRFILKVLVVLLTAGGVFAYYLWDLRRDPHDKTIVPQVGTWAASALMLVAIVLGFFLVGSPAQQRLIRLDGQRVNDLATIQNEVINFYVLKRTIPQTLSELNNPMTGFSVPTDPVTQEAYTYTPKGDLTFELCATFAKKSPEGTTSAIIAREVMYSSPYGTPSETWTHDAGLTCFERTIDPTLYPSPTPVTK